MYSGIEQSKNGELLRNPDFRKIFSERMAEITPLTSDEGRDEAGFLQIQGVSQIKRKAVALIFPSETRHDIDDVFDIWVDDPANMENKTYPHWEAEASLRNFIRMNGYHHIVERSCFYMLSSFVIQDSDDKFYLITTRNFTRTAVSETSSEHRTGFFSFLYKRWADLVDKYGLEGILGEVDVEIKHGNYVSYSSRRDPILSRDLVGEIRENTYLLSFAEKYQMTYSQYMRFRTMALCAKEGQASVVYDSLAQEIVDDDKDRDL